MSLSSSIVLSHGAIAEIANNDNTTLQPIVQILEVKKAITGDNKVRWRLVITDGQSWIQGMLSSQQTHLIEQKLLQKHSVCKLNEYVCQLVGGRRIVVLINIELVQQCDAPLVQISQLKKVDQAQAQNQNQNRNQNRPQPNQNSNSNNNHVCLCLFCFPSFCFKLKSDYKYKFSIFCIPN
jgi:replication factor A1